MASVEQRASDFRVVWRQAGEKQYERFPTRKHADEFAALVKAQGNRWPKGWIPGRGWSDEQPSTVPTFGEWAARAIASRATANARTRHDYERELRLHLAPTFGDTPMDRITRELVGLWLVQMQATLSPKTLKNVQSLASSIMGDAIDHGLVVVNPFRSALRGLPASKQEEMTFLTRGEFDTLLAATPEPYRPLVMLLAHTGLRWSEATALQVRDVDVLAKRLTVVRAWKRTPENFFELGEPKSRRSRRTVTFSSHVARALVPLVASREPDEFVFTTVQGRPVRHNNFWNRVWLPTVHAARRCPAHADAEKPCACPGTLTKTPNIHSMRHSHASWLIGDGKSLVVVQRRLGHESITTTIDRYGHLVPDLEDDLADSLEGWGPVEVPVTST